MPTDAINIINDFMQKVSKLGLGTIGTITGRYYAMDRDSNYDRVKKHMMQFVIMLEILLVII